MVVQVDVVVNVDWVGAIAENSLSSQIPSSSHIRLHIRSAFFIMNSIRGDTAKNRIKHVCVWS